MANIEPPRRIGPIYDYTKAYYRRHDGCFTSIILGASAVSQLDNYRLIRDEILDKSEIGRTLIDAYYQSEVLRNIADFVINHPLANKTAKVALNAGSQAIEMAKPYI